MNMVLTSFSITFYHKTSLFLTEVCLNHFWLKGQLGLIMVAMDKMFLLGMYHCTSRASHGSYLRKGTWESDVRKDSAGGQVARGPGVLGRGQGFSRA